MPTWPWSYTVEQKKHILDFDEIHGDGWPWFENPPYEILSPYRKGKVKLWGLKVVIFEKTRYLKKQQL